MGLFLPLNKIYLTLPYLITLALSVIIIIIVHSYMAQYQLKFIAPYMETAKHIYVLIMGMLS